MDPIALLTSAVVATMVSALLFLLPGAALGWLVLPGASTPLARIGRAAGVSLLATLVSCTLLARFGVLTGPAVVAALLGMTALGLALRRPRFGRPWRRPRARRWWAGAAAGSALALVLIILPSHLAVRPDLLPVSSTTWYYLNLAQATADLGAFPASLPEWGALRPFQTDYLPITAHTAAALQLLPGDVLERIEAYRLLILALALLFATLLFRRFVSVWTAMLGAILLLGTLRLDQKFDGYRPETVALVLALFTLYVADRAIAERDRRAWAVAALSGALVFLGHAEVYLVMAPALVGIGIARSMTAPAPRSAWLGVRIPTLRGTAPAVMAVALAGAGMGVGTSAAWGLTGDLGVLGYVAGSERPTPDAATVRGRPGEIPAGWTFTDDPTWDFYLSAVSPSLVGSQPPDSFTDPLLLPRSTLVIWPGLDARTRSGMAVVAALIVAPLLAWPLLDRRRRRWILAWGIFGVLLVAGSIMLYAVADTYVPQRTAGRRLIPYLTLIPVVAATVLLWGTGRIVGPYWRALLPQRGTARSVLAGALLALLTIGAISTSPAVDTGDEDREASLSPAGYAAFRWMADNLPADARILANAYTDGSIAAVIGRVGIIDGRAVYLENPTFLAESTALSLGARVVFATPAAPGAATYLDRENVTHLLVATQGRTGIDLGGYPLFQTDLASLVSDPGFRLVRAFDGERLLLLEVVSAG